MIRREDVFTILLTTPPRLCTLVIHAVTCKVGVNTRVLVRYLHIAGGEDLREGDAAVAVLCTLYLMHAYKHGLPVNGGGIVQARGYVSDGHVFAAKSGYN